jgi:polysaccharide chain length determinant protein (PEP-CTERM system associated)
VSNPEIDARINGLQQKLDGFRLNYTEQHPDIVGIMRIIAQLKEQKKAESKPAPGKPAPTPAQTQNPYFQQMNLAIAEAEARMASMKARVAEYQKRFDQLKSAVNAIPQVEAEFKQLTRDYEVTKGNYEKLLSRRESAQISGEMEANASVMDFRVIDPPQVPSTPNAPNRPLLMSMVLLAALGGGIGFAFMISQLKPTIHDERGLREVSGLPVFGSVMMAWSEAQRSKWKKGLVAFFASFLSLLSAYGAIMAVLIFTTARN